MFTSSSIAVSVAGVGDHDLQTALSFVILSAAFLLSLSFKLAYYYYID